MIFISETRDEYDDDFDRMRQASLKTKQERAKQELGAVIENVDRLRQRLRSAKDQVQGLPEYGIA